MESIWSEVHTLTYRPYAAALRLQESEAAVSIALPGSLAGELQLRRGPPPTAVLPGSGAPSGIPNCRWKV